MEFKKGTLVKLKCKAGKHGMYANIWNPETKDYAHRNHANMPDKYPEEHNYITRYALISADDIGIFVETVQPHPEQWGRAPVDVVLINERLVGVEARRIRGRGWPRTVRHESQIKRITKMDHRNED